MAATAAENDLELWDWEMGHHLEDIEELDPPFVQAVIDLSNLPTPDAGLVETSPDIPRRAQGIRPEPA